MGVECTSRSVKTKCTCARCLLLQIGANESVLCAFRPPEHMQLGTRLWLRCPFFYAPIFRAPDYAAGGGRGRADVRGFSQAGSRCIDGLGVLWGQHYKGHDAPRRRQRGRRTRDSSFTGGACRGVWMKRRQLSEKRLSRFPVLSIVHDEDVLSLFGESPQLIVRQCTTWRGRGEKEAELYTPSGVGSLLSNVASLPWFRIGKTAVLHRPSHLCWRELTTHGRFRACFRLRRTARQNAGWRISTVASDEPVSAHPNEGRC